MRLQSPALLAASALFAAPCLLAQSLTPAPSASLGFDPARLNRLTGVLQQEVDAGHVAGVVVLVARGGKTGYFEAIGKADVEQGVPMQKDTIFRIASMTKAVTSVAAMILVEEGRLSLKDPVSKYIPAFKKTTVMVPAPPGAVPGTPLSAVPAKREISVRDLLTHTAGISYGWGPLEPQYKAAGVLGWYFADKDEPILAAVERLATLPFDAQPGEKYVYGFNTDILGAVVEKAAGTSLDAFFDERILGPLKMTDTHFFLPKEKKSRLAAVYSLKDVASRIERAPNEGTGQGAYFDGPRACFSGGAGLLSTARDYGRFLEMMRRGGELDGARILSPKTVDLMTRNHIGELRGAEGGFGLGFGTVEDIGRSGRHGTAGEFGWGGAYFTNDWVDPKEGLVAVFMAQLLPSGGLNLHDRFRAIVYSSIVGPPAVVRPVR